MESDGLVKLVEEFKRKREWNDTELCNFLGIRNDAWSRIKNGQRRPPESFRRAVWDNIPALRDYIFIS